MNRALMLGFVLAGGAALAQQEAILGFQDNGTAVAFGHEGMEDLGEPSRLIVRDLTTLAQVDKVVEDASSLEALTPHLKDLRGPGKWVKPGCGRTSPDGKSSLVVKPVMATDGQWSGGSWSAAGSSAWVISVARQGKELPQLQVAAADTLTPCWTPDGKRVVLVLGHAGTNMRDPGFSEYFFGSSEAAPLAVAGPSLEAARSAAASLSKTGLVVTSVTLARKKRDKTVVYIAKGQEALGAKVAAALKGATVMPFDWASPFQVMVALGP